jgi:hypothetical protein
VELAENLMKPKLLRGSPLSHSMRRRLANIDPRGLRLSPMGDQPIFPFGFLRDHLLRQVALRNLPVANEETPSDQRVIAVGVAGALDDHSVEEQLSKWLPKIDAAVLFSGMKFEGRARESTQNSLLALFKASGIPVQVVDQEAALSNGNLGLSVFAAMDHISAAMLDRIPIRPAT